MIVVVPVAVSSQAGVESNANVRRNRDESMIVPPGTVFAYGVVELDIEKNGFFGK